MGSETRGTLSISKYIFGHFIEFKCYIVVNGENLFFITFMWYSTLPSDKNVNFVPHELLTFHYWNVPVQLYHKGYPQYDLTFLSGWGSLQKLDKMKFLLQLVLWAGSAGLIHFVLKNLPKCIQHVSLPHSLPVK